MLYLSTLLFSMCTTVTLIPILQRFAQRIGCIDQPAARKVHAAPIPRVGGIAMAVGVLIPVLLWAVKDKAAISILMGAAIIVLFGLLDDIMDLGYRVKFAGQLFAGMTVVVGGGLKIGNLSILLPGGYLLPEPMVLFMSLLMILAVTNAVNLSDGLDGLAGGIMLMSFVCIGFVAYREQYPAIVQLAVATAGAIFGFLRFNTHPATVFMGDAGSQLLGFLAAAMLIAITQRNSPLNPFFPLLLLGLPVMDTGMVIIERVAGGRSPFKADKNHLHHKLLSLNLYHREAVFIIYLLQAAMVTAAFVFRFSPQWWPLPGYLAFCGGAILLLSLAVKNGWHLERPGAFDRIVKRKLKMHLKERHLTVKVSQAVMENGFLMVLVAVSTMPADLPGYTALAAVGLSLALALASLGKPWYGDMVLRALIYFFMPVLIYFCEQQPYSWIPQKFIIGFNLSFGILVLFTLLTLKTTRRQSGYDASPLDFLILFMALVAPNLPEAGILRTQLGFTATKIMVLFFVFEVLIGELRGELRRIKQFAFGALLVVATRWVI
jgi:UDP-GlcNAc:undecaprenyl-phosphate GlcNAc-1-phosphate transferase